MTPKKSKSTECAYESCFCPADGEDVVEVGGKQYCSQGCADGDGCEHAECDCATTASAEAEE